MGLICQFSELLEAGCAFVESNQGGIDGGQIQSGVRTAEPPETRKCSRRGIHWEQMENLTTKADYLVNKEYSIYTGFENLETHPPGRPTSINHIATLELMKTAFFHIL